MTLNNIDIDFRHELFDQISNNLFQIRDNIEKSLKSFAEDAQIKYHERSEDILFEYGIETCCTDDAIKISDQEKFKEVMIRTIKNFYPKTIFDDGIHIGYDMPGIFLYLVIFTHFVMKYIDSFTDVGTYSVMISIQTSDMEFVSALNQLSSETMERQLKEELMIILRVNPDDLMIKHWMNIDREFNDECIIFEFCCAKDLSKFRRNTDIFEGILLDKLVLIEPMITKDFPSYTLPLIDIQFQDRMLIYLYKYIL